MSKALDRAKVIAEVETFREEYPDYTDEHINDYLNCIDDFTNAEKHFFIELLGY